MTKKCNKCKEVKEDSYFTKDLSSSDELRAHCKECAKDYWNNYKENNKEKLAQRSQQNRDARALSNIKRRAKQKNLSFDLSLEDIQGVLVCPVFGFELKRSIGKATKDSLSVDRIYPEKGYVKDNIQIMSNKANTMKQDATPEELLMFADWIIKTYRK